MYSTHLTMQMVEQQTAERIREAERQRAAASGTPPKRRLRRWRIQVGRPAGTSARPRARFITSETRERL
jgi:hypothetical protein